MTVWTDALSVLTGEWQLVAVILVFVFIGQSLGSFVLRKIFGEGFLAIEYQVLGLAGWLVPASLFSLFWYITRLNWIVLVLPVVWILYILLRIKLDFRPASVSRVLFLILTVFLFVLLRLVYVSNALFPLYFDSAQHYAVIKNIVQQSAAWVFNWLNIVYYHLGFHFLTAFFASALNVEITRSMLVLGQVILALIPFSVFFPVRHATKSNSAGWFAVLLSAFGWYMPAHAVDWGKYPALMSLGMIPFTLSLIYLLKSQNPNSINLPVKVRWVIHGLIGLSALLTVFAHSRSLIVLSIVCLAWIVSAWWQKFPKRQAVFVVIVIITLLEAIFILKQSVLVLLFDPYLYRGILITGLVLFLSIFAWTGYPRFTFIIVLTTTLLLACLFIPVTILPGYRDLTLLDRPFVEMILFMPLSMLGGLGLSGLEKKLQGRFVWSRYVGLLAFGVVIVNAYFTYDLYPSDCCVIVGNDDVVAMDWVANQLPIDARIGISSTQLRVLTSDVSEGDVGADAGIWITPLTGRVTVSLPYNTDFNDSVTWKTICEKRVDYLFVGEAGYPFDSGKIDAHPEWYRRLLSMPKTRVFEVIGCDQ